MLSAIRTIVAARTSARRSVPVRARCERFVAGRAFVRDVLAAYVECAAADIEFVTDEHGKLAIKGTAGIHFNVSHSGGRIVCVVAGYPVGVDVERVRPIPDAFAIAQSFFSPMEIAALREADPEDRSYRFLVCWTRKEAFAKADGRGLSLPFNSFSVSVDPASPSLLAADGSDRVPCWSLQNLLLDSHYVGCVAAAHTSPEIRVQQWWD